MNKTLKQLIIEIFGIEPTLKEQQSMKHWAVNLKEEITATQIINLGKVLEERSLDCKIKRSGSGIRIHILSET